MFGKHHCTGGQGGVVYTRDEDLYWRARRFADRGKPFNTDAPGNVVAGLNCNLTDLAAAIGSVQLRKLPGIVARRRDVGEAVKEALRDNPIVSVGWQVPETECVYWFLRIRLEAGRVTVDKERFCAALAAEGLAVTPSYDAISCDRPWFRDRAVFGRSGFPWTAAEYEGPREPEPDIANARKAVAGHFNVALHENYTERDTRDIIDALAKVADAYAK
jgi:dTDP-4-amino-4,6-dideoxygalactose transaminase